MSRYLLSYWLLFPLLATPLQGAKRPPIEKTAFPWLKTGRPYTFILESVEGANENRLRIEVPGRHDFILSVPGGIVTVNDGLLNKKLAADNLLKSNYLYLSPKFTDIKERSMLFVFGSAYGSSPGSVRVLSLDQSGYPVEVFSSNEFEVTALTDLNGDGIAEIIGKRCLSQISGTCLSTYDPYSVYRLPRSGVGKAMFSLTLSKAYNLKHYYGWAGPHCREDVTVVLCAPKGQRRMMNAKKAEKLYRQ
jgi:hypothetical protein